MLACPPFFIIAIRATLLITYAIGHVAAAFSDLLQDLSSKPQVTRNMQPLTHSPNTYPMIRANLLEPILEAIRALDKAVSKGVIHRNTAARKKSALARRLVTA